MTEKSLFLKMPKNEDLQFANMVKKLNNCNNCGNKECEHRPKLGEIVRFNCFAWKSKVGD